MLVGLTGGLASGKSLVSRELKRLGALLIDADEVSREVTRPGARAYREIVGEFGQGLVLPDGTIDRKKLGRMVFSDPLKLERLNEITHPEIRKRIEELIEETKHAHKNHLIVVDAALLIETGLYKNMDKVVVVYADEENQVARLVKRDRLSEEEARARIASQMPLKEKLKLADHVVDNNNGIEETLKNTKKLFSLLRT